MQVNGGSGHSTGSSGVHNGGGGSGGRLAVYFNVNKTFSGSFEAYGGKGGGPGASVGGAGSIFLYHKGHKHRTLQISNKGGGAVIEQNQIINDWTNYQSDASKAWIITNSKHVFAADLNYHFEELQLRNDAHLAFRGESTTDKVSLYFRHMIGDRSATIHVGANQSMDLDRDEIDLPFNARVYKHGHMGLASMTFVHGIKIYNHGTITRIVNLTLHHGGEAHFHAGSRLGNISANDDYVFHTVRIQAGGVVRFFSPPASHQGMNLTTKLTYIEGGGKLIVNDIRVLSHTIVIDSGGHFSADGQGYKISDSTGKYFFICILRHKLETAFVFPLQISNGMNMIQQSEAKKATSLRKFKTLLRIFGFACLF